MHCELHCVGRGCFTSGLLLDARHTAGYPVDGLEILELGVSGSGGFLGSEPRALSVHVSGARCARFESVAVADAW